MIIIGAELIDNFSPVLLLFAAILLYSSYKLIFKGGEDESEDMSDNSIVRFCRYAHAQDRAAQEQRCLDENPSA